jgi:S1-C subfamily serine protease
VKSSARKPKREQYFRYSGALAFLGLGLLLLALICASTGASPETAKESVVIVDATVEVSPSPFLFFFSSAHIPKDVTASPKRISHYRGTGFFVNGHLITAAHVVLPDAGDKVLSISITSYKGKSAKVSVDHSDKKLDLAELVLVKGERLALPSLHLSESNPIVGEKVTEIGHPGMIHFVVSRGEIIGFDLDQDYNIAALDTFGGNSGGPILNAQGRVVGLTHTLLRGSRFTGIGTLEALRDFLYPERVR